jgi:hypothetical protein
VCGHVEDFPLVRSNLPQDPCGFPAKETADQSTIERCHVYLTVSLIDCNRTRHHRQASPPVGFDDLARVTPMAELEADKRDRNLMYTPTDSSAKKEMDVRPSGGHMRSIVLACVAGAALILLTVCRRPGSSKE